MRHSLSAPLRAAAMISVALLGTASAEESAASNEAAMMSPVVKKML